MDFSWLSNMFVLGVPWIEKILRPILVYLFLVVGLRLAGKRELAQLNPFDLVVLLMLSNTVQNAIIGNDTSITGGILGASTLLIINYLIVRFLYDHKGMEATIEGKPDDLILHGEIVESAIKNELITLEELEEAARSQGIASLAEVERATLEPGGAIAFLQKQPRPEEARHEELLERIDALSREIAELRAELNRQAIH